MFFTNADAVAGQAAIDQNLEELKALFRRLAQKNEEFARSLCDFMHEDAHDNGDAADRILRQNPTVQKMMLLYLIPCAVVGWQMAMMSINNEHHDDETENGKA